MIRRAIYLIFAFTIGLPFMLVKWVLLGTKASRDRKKLIRLTKKQNRLLQRQHAARRP